MAPFPIQSASIHAAPAGSIASPDPRAPPDLDACILEVLRDPFPGENVPADRFYGDAVEAFSKGRDDYATKLFSETYLYTGTNKFVALGHFGHGEIERRLREPIHRHFALGRYDRILALKTPHPLRELTLLRKSQGLAAIGKPEAALSTLVELDARATLGRCDASIRTAMAVLLDDLVGGSSKLDPKACLDARTVAERLGADATSKAVAARCPPS